MSLFPTGTVSVVLGADERPCPHCGVPTVYVRERYYSRGLGGGKVFVLCVATRSADHDCVRHVSLAYEEMEPERMESIKALLRKEFPT